MGWDAADWQVIHPLLDAGTMPHLRSLIEGGVMGKLKSLAPPYCSLLGATAITGHTPDRHGVLAPNAVLSNVKTVPDILREKGIPVFTAGWSSDIAPGIVRADYLTGEDLLPFVPRLNRIDQKADRRLVTLATALAETIDTHAAATAALEANPTGFFAFRYRLLESLGAEFMQFHPPRLPRIAETDFEIWSGTMAAAYRFLDMKLDRILELAGEDACIVLMSDHGFENGDARPSKPIDMLWHRDRGIFCMAGPEIHKDETIHGIGLLDIAPTLLTLCGVPSGQDMKGRAPADAFAAIPLIGRVPSYETSDAEAVRQLLQDMGYPQAKDSERSITELFSLVQVHLAAGRAAEALPLAREMVRRHPLHPANRLWLAVCCLESGLIAECHSLAAELLAEEPGMPAASAVLACAYLSEGNPQQALRCLADAERRETPFSILDFTIARAHFALGRWKDAETWFRTVIERERDHVQARLGLCRTLLQLGRYEAAAEAALDAIVIEHNQPEAHRLLALALAHQHA